MDMDWGEQEGEVSAPRGAACNKTSGDVQRGSHSHVWMLRTTGKLDFQFYFILINFWLNSYLQLLAIVFIVYYWLWCSSLVINIAVGEISGNTREIPLNVFK